jgi:L-Ala-D/L-Glu epimerase
MSHWRKRRGGYPTNNPLKLHINHESWPIAGRFTIARGSKTTAEVVVVTLEHAGHRGRGECVPYARYQETIPQTIDALEKNRHLIEAGMTRQQAQSLNLPKAAANALDCALWDLEAKSTGCPTWQSAGLAPPKALITAYTLSLDTPENMAKSAASASHRPLLKLKLGADGDAERLRLIRKAAPECQLIVDANEGWTENTVEDMLNHCYDAGVSLVEQPLPAAADAILARIKRKAPVCADESAHDIKSLPELAGKYDALNIKLDKTGGLTSALELAIAAQNQGLKIMAGCMLATSLAMAPALLLAQMADIIDLDGPLLLAKDRQPGLTFTGSTIHPAPPDLWG